MTRTSFIKSHIALNLYLALPSSQPRINKFLAFPFFAAHQESMPPKKAVKAAQKPSLKGCAITFASNSIPASTLSLKNLAEVKIQIAENGGSYVTKVEQCTHLVATDTQYQKDLAKVKEAKDKTAVTILSYDWLEEALSAKTPVDEKDYILHDRGQASSGPALAINTKDSTSASAKNEDEEDASASNNVSKKRKRTAAVKYEEDESDLDEEEPQLNTEKTNGKASNVTKNKALNIPLDEGLIKKQGTNYQVYVDPDDSVIFDVTLSQSDSGDNANKFYRMQLLKNTTTGTWCTWTRWGRVGENGQSAILGSGSFSEAMVQFEKKFKDKTGNTWADRNGPLKAKKYTFIERSYDDSDSEGEEDLSGAEKRRKLKQEPGEEEEEEEIKEIKSKLPEPVQDLMKLIFNQDFFKATFDSFDYDAEKMPLGKLSKSTLMRGYEVLKTLSGLVGSAGNANQITTLSNQYLSLIPHVVSRSSRPPVLSDMTMIKKEIELLEALTDMQLANDLMKNAKKEKDKAEELNLLDRQFQGLGMQEMEPLSRDTKEFTELEAYLTKSVGYTHGSIQYKVQDIFRIERQGEHDRFDQSSYAKIPNKNRRLLWHGSRATNFGGILSQGLRIAPPEAPASGYMFGKGVYLADMSSKSANYCCSYSSGNTGLLLLCEAELGEPPLKLTNADYDAGAKAKQQNCLSTWGVGRTAPKAWKDASALHPSLTGVTMPDVVSQKPGDTGEQGVYLQYNEFIVYDVAQIKLRYLFRVNM